MDRLAGHLLYTNNFHFLTINIYFSYLFYLNFSVFRSGWPVGKIATSAAPLNFLAGKITSRAKAICVPHSFDPSFQLILELFFKKTIKQCETIHLILV